MRIERTKAGARVHHGRHLVSVLPRAPGPTHSVFDVLAALAASLAPTDRPLAMLGFAAGGTVAPLRALDFKSRIEAVDLSLDAVPTFHEVARAWSGEVTIDRDDAARWLESRPNRFGAIVEDLSITLPDDVTKPEVSWTVLPALMRHALVANGVAIVNALPVAGMSWRELVGRIAAPFEDARLVRLDEFDNRLVVLGRTLPSAREVRRRIDNGLAAMRSRQRGRLNVRRLPAGLALPT